MDDIPVRTGETECLIAARAAMRIETPEACAAWGCGDVSSPLGRRCGLKHGYSIGMDAGGPGLIAARAAMRIETRESVAVGQND